MGVTTLRAFLITAALSLKSATAADSFAMSEPAVTLLTVEIVESGQLPVNQPIEIMEVPEPSSLLLLIPAGLLALSRRR
jgi:hypothetical protein